jgi:hypothetical protein
MIPFLYLIGLGSKCKNNQTSFLCLENCIRVSASDWHNEAEKGEDGRREQRGAVTREGRRGSEKG